MATENLGERARDHYTWADIGGPRSPPPRETRMPRIPHIVLVAFAVFVGVLSPLVAQDAPTTRLSREQMWFARTAEDWAKRLPHSLATHVGGRSGRVEGDRQAHPHLRQHGRRDRERALRGRALPSPRDGRSLRRLHLRDRVDLPPHPARSR
jgi:hypothetical protein